jgi:hypothetical protein
MLLELLLIAVIAVSGWRVVVLMNRRERAAAIHAALQTFGPAQAAVQADPRQLVTWYPLAQAARKLQPAAFAALDAATGRTFPFTRDQVEQAHARVSSEWLAWEKAHDEEYRLKAAATEQEMARASGEAGALLKARLDRIQHEKIERYQQRYEAYIRDAKALQALLQ